MSGIVLLRFSLLQSLEALKPMILAKRTEILESLILLTPLPLNRVIYITSVLN